MMPTRAIFWNIEYHMMLYVMLVIAAAIAGYGAYQHYRRWRIGHPEKIEIDVSAGLRDLFTYAVMHKRMMQERYAGIMHVFIMLGFAFLTLATISVFLQQDLGLPVFHGGYYLFIKFTANLFGALAVLGVLMAIYRRYVQKPAQLDNKKDDSVMLCGILAALVTGFLLESVRLAAQNDPWQMYSFVSSGIALLFAGLPYDDLVLMYQTIWWTHVTLIMCLIAYMPYSKLFHVILVPLNIFLRRRDAVPGVFPLIDFEDEEIETYGKNNIEEFSQKTLLDSDVCVRCGRCEAFCPAHRSGKALSPKNITQKFRAAMEAEAARLALAEKTAVPASDAGADEDDDVEEKPRFITDDELWACTTCRSCEAQCPAFIGHVDRLIELRRNSILMEKPFPDEAKQTFRNLENNGNPWGIGSSKRAEFLESLGVPTLEDNPDAEYLYWPGCFGAFDARNQKVTAALVKLLQAAGVNFAILGEEETCCGDSARNLGNEYLYSMLAESNIDTMNEYGIKKIITQCPHCFHTLKYEYPQMGGHYEVIHHTEFLMKLVAEGKLKFNKMPEATAVYHDSCYLGRYHGIYEAPRRLLGDVMNGVAEMENNHAKSFCCGAGGGRMWLEEKEGEHMNKLRAAEAVKCRTDYIVTACPFCLTMFEDGVNSLDDVPGKKGRVEDLAEILAKQLK